MTAHRAVACRPPSPVHGRAEAAERRRGRCGRDGALAIGAVERSNRLGPVVVRPDRRITA